jgi:hypothetical protein
VNVALAARPFAHAVPAEARGLARQFRASVRTEDLAFDAALAAIVKPLRSRVRHHPRLRHEQLAQAGRLYRTTIPSGFRIGAAAIAPDRATFEIREHRLTASWLHDSRWEGDADYSEPGVGLMRFMLALKDGKLTERWHPIALVSAHALGRYFERSGKRDHVALVAALALLVDARDAGGDTVATDGDGAWIGAEVLMRGPHGTTRARTVRTWHF